MGAGWGWGKEEDRARTGKRGDGRVRKEGRGGRGKKEREEERGKGGEVSLKSVCMGCAGRQVSARDPRWQKTGLLGLEQLLANLLVRLQYYVRDSL